MIIKLTNGDVDNCTHISEKSFRFVKKHHDHHKAPVGSVFQIAVSYVEDNKSNPVTIAVAIVGRPVANNLQDGFTLEVTRLCTDRVKRYNENGKELNPCSMLYAACWRVCRELGYKKLITYTLDTEPGTSVKAAGWKVIGERGGGSWSRPSRPRVDKAPLQKKILFEKS